MNRVHAHSVVVGVDGSGESIEALRYAQRLAPVFGATIHAISAWEYPVEYGGYVPLGSDNYEEVTRKRLDKALAEAFGGVEPHGIKSTVVFAHPAQALIEASLEAALLVVGRRGHGKFRGLLLGSVSAACVAHSHCPVLIVKESNSDEQTS